MSWKQRLEGILGRKEAPWWIALVGISLGVGSLGQGFLLDDYVQQTHVFGVEGQIPKAKKPWMEFFAFVKDKAALEDLQRKGILPWWSDPDLRMAFLRPFSSATHLVDYALWPKSPVWMHVQNLAWFGLLLLLLMGFLRRVGMEAWQAGVVGFLYGTFHGFAAPVAWLANRNAMIAAVFGIGCLWMHHRWRAEGRLSWGIAAWCFLGLGLSAGEAAIAVGSYLLAYAVILERRAGWKPWLSLLPYLGVVVIWRIVYKALGFGVYGSGLYIDPLHDPWRFGQAVIERVPLLLFGQWGFPPISLYTVLPQPLQGWFWWWAVGGVLACGYLFWPLRRQPLAQFFGLGMAGALVPICATFPDERLLFFVGIGGFGLLALFFLEPIQEERGQPWRSRLWKLGFWSLLVFHVLISPPLAILRSFQMKVFDGFVQKAADSLPLHRGRDKTFVVLATFNSFFDMNVIPRLLWQKGWLLPEFYVLSSSVEGAEIRVTGPKTLTIQPKGGFVQGIDLLFRSEARGFRVGQTLKIKNLGIEIQEVTREGKAWKVQFSFSKALDPGSMVFLLHTYRGYREIKLPPRGGVLQLPPIWVF